MDKKNQDIEQALIAETSQFLAELSTEAKVCKISLDTDLERELGIDSIKKVELFHRIEATFDITLPEKLLSQAATLQDFVVPITKAGPSQVPQKRKVSTQQKKAHFNPQQADSFVDVLYGYAASDPERVHIYFQDEHAQETPITYAELLTNAEQVAASFQAYGIKPHETCAIMLPTSKEFFYTFFGLLLVGAIPIPIYPPFRPDQIEEYVSRSILILRSASIRLLITFEKAAILSKQLKPFIPSLIATLTLPQLLKRKNYPFKKVSISDQHPALIQYTSGSTGSPKGVLLYHANLLNNLRAAIKALKITEKDVVVSWLPLYHDMGLIGKWLGSLYYGIPASIMPPQSFLARPERWLWNIHYHRGTISAAPNFAYGYCTQKITDKAIEGLDLSSWRLAANGAEAVDGNIFRAFYKRFADYGLKETAPTAVYGLAESTVALSFSDVHAVQTYDYVDQKTLQEEKIAKKASKKDKNTLEFTNCGQPIPGHEIRIVDENDKPLASRHVGILQFKGPSSLVAYYQNVQATEAIKRGKWYQTGDLAYIAEGNLYITGRIKDIIIKAGRNISPEAIEEVTSQVAEIRKGCVIAFGVHDALSGTEQLIIVAEVRHGTKRSFSAIRDEIIQYVSTQLGDPPDKIILVKPGRIPKTSSGKLRRAQCKTDYLQGKLGHAGPPRWWQLTKIIGKSYFKKLISWCSILGRALYTVYVSLWLIICLLPLWLLVMIVPRKQASVFTQQTFRFLLFIVGMPVMKNRPVGLGTDEKPAIFVANHASYLDSIVLVAHLPANVAFIAKKEVLKAPILATFVKKLAYITVQREDVKDSVEAFETTHKVLQAGRSVMIFPEGGIFNTPGLRPFKSGAFSLAVNTSCPIYPISLNGTRGILRNDNFLLRPGKITLTYHPPLIPENTTWTEISRLSDAARTAIVKECGEQLM